MIELNILRKEVNSVHTQCQFDLSDSASFIKKNKKTKTGNNKKKNERGNTRENNKIGLLSKNHAFYKGSGVEVRASSHLGRKHILTRRGLSIPIMHIRHLQYLKAPTFPKP